MRTSDHKNDPRPVKKMPKNQAILDRIQELEAALRTIRDGPVSTICGYCIGRVECAEQALEVMDGNNNTL